MFPGLTVRENIMLGASNRGRIAERELLAESYQMFDLFPDIRKFADSSAGPSWAASSKWSRSPAA